MHYEVEQKFPLTEPDDVQAQLAALGADFQTPIEQIDHYFRHPCRDFAQTDEALRLRQTGRDNFITYKGPKIDPTSKTRHELELPLAAGQAALDQFTEMLVALGFSLVGTVQKQRRQAVIQWQGFEVQCALDDVAGAGLFLELEISAHDASLETAKKSLIALSGNLALGPSERRSYLELILFDNK